MIGERHFNACVTHQLGEEIGRDPCCFVAHQIITRQMQQLGFSRAGFLQPLLETNCGTNILRNQIIVKRSDQCLIDQNILPPGFMLEIFDFAD